MSYLTEKKLKNSPTVYFSDNTLEKIYEIADHLKTEGLAAILALAIAKLHEQLTSKQRTIKEYKHTDN